MKDWKYINGAEIGNESTGDFTNLINRASKLMQSHPEKKARLEEIKSFVKHAHNLPGERWQYHIDRLNKELNDIEKSKVGNSIYSELNKGDKRVVIESDGSWYVYDKNGKIVEQGRESNSDNAFGKFKAKGYNKKACNQDGVARMFDGLVKDEKKEVEKDSGAIEDLEKVGNSAFDDGAKKGKEDKRKGKLITMAGFEMHAPGYSNLSFKEKEEYRKGYYSTNDLTKDDIYKQWKTGNSYYDKLPTAMDYQKALDEIIEKKNLNPGEARRKYGQFTYAQWEKELGHKIGNSEDDKFAYVMREFEEGKLKTPDGKVVTNPEQAKAIAYSESKKAENGLSRARKAMKV